MLCGKLEKYIIIIRQVRIIECCFVTPKCTAALAPVKNNPAFLSIVVNPDRLEYAFTIVRSISGVNVYME